MNKKKRTLYNLGLKWHFEKVDINYRRFHAEAAEGGGSRALARGRWPRREPRDGAATSLGCLCEWGGGGLRERGRWEGAPTLPEARTMSLGVVIVGLLLLNRPPPSAPTPSWPDHSSNGRRPLPVIHRPDSLLMDF